ncbi:MAG TPA: cupredoxin domain-containing protein [Roseiflexaceae bacterium]|nr:cupredoxin domain-containing protein [Roseiflexaceae bacterium]
MDTPMVAIPSQRLAIQPTLRTIVVGALVVNGLTFLLDMFMLGPNEINVSHVIIALVVAGIAALRFRWAPAIAALVGVALLIEGYIFASHELTEPDSAASFASIAIFFATSLVALVAGIAATVQNYSAPRSKPFVAQPAPRWVYPSLLALAALVLGGILSTAIQPRGVLPSFSPEALAALPALTAKDYLFEQPKITAKVGETVVLRLDNADTSTHHFDLDEFNVHALMPVGKSNVTLFKPTQPGTYTFYCQPHADKAARAGMVGTLVVEP